MSIRRRIHTGGQCQADHFVGHRSDPLNMVLESEIAKAEKLRALSQRSTWPV